MYASVRERCVYVEFSMHVFLYLSFSRSLRDKQCAAMLHIFRLLLSLLFNLLAILVDLFYNTKKFYFLLSLYRAVYRYVCVLVSGPIDAFIAYGEKRRSASVVCQIELNRFLVCASQKYHLIFFEQKSTSTNEQAVYCFLLLLVFFFCSYFYWYVGVMLSHLRLSLVSPLPSRIWVDSDTHTRTHAHTHITQTTQIYIFHIALTFERLLVICSSRLFCLYSLCSFVFFESMHLFSEYNEIIFILTKMNMEMNE